MYFTYACGNIDSCLLANMAFDRYVAICDPFHYVTIMSCPRCVLLVAFSCSLPHLHSLLHTLLLNQLTFCDSSIIHHVLCNLSPLIKLSCSPTFVNAHYGNTLLRKHLLCLQPVSTYTVRDHMATIVYTVLSSMLNPFIYSLRNKDLNQGPRKLVGRRKPQTTPS